MDGNGGETTQGLIYSKTLGDYDEKYWWNAGKLVLDVSNAGAVYWQECLDDETDMCVYGQQGAPYLYSDSNNLRVSENQILLPGFSGTGSSGSSPDISTITYFLCDYNREDDGCPGVDTGQVMKAAGTLIVNMFASSTWQISFSATGYYTVYHNFALSGAQTYSVPSITFVELLAQGQLRFVMSWKYTCPDGRPTCEDQLQPFRSASCVEDGCVRWGSDEVDTLIMPSSETWLPDGTNTQRYAFWRSPSITNQGASIAYADDAATGGYTETTLFENLHLASNSAQEVYSCYVNAFSGGALAPGQVTAYVYCGEGTCEDAEGAPLDAGLVETVELPAQTDPEIYWWSAGTVINGGGLGKVRWMTCKGKECFTKSQELSPFLYGQSTNLRVSENTLLFGKVTGVSSAVPASNDVDYLVERTEYVGGPVEGAAEAVLGFDQGALWKAKSGIRVHSGSYKITYSADGFMDFIDHIEVYGGEVVVLSDVVFVEKNLLQGMVRVVMQWKYQCADGSAKCDSPSRPFLSSACTMEDCARTGAGEVDTLIMPNTQDWKSTDPDVTEAQNTGYAYWDDPEITSGTSTIGYNEAYATGGYYETTLFTDLHRAETRVQTYSVWVHAFSGENGCRASEWGEDDPCDDYALSQAQVQVNVYCGPSTCADEEGFLISQAGIVGGVVQPDKEGIFWWNTGQLSVNSDGVVSWTMCDYDEDATCASLSDLDSPYAFGRSVYFLSV